MSFRHLETNVCLSLDDCMLSGDILYVPNIFKLEFVMDTRFLLICTALNLMKINQVRLMKALLIVMRYI